MKTCSVCSKEKSLDEYYNYKATKDGKSYRCKDCDDIARRKWSITNPKKAKASARERQLKHKYGITLKEYEELLEKQGGCCAICKTPRNRTSGTNEEKWNYSVDHNHETGKVRGLLCNQCNRGLGMFLDDKNILLAARDYLEWYETH